MNAIIAKSKFGDALDSPGRFKQSLENIFGKLVATALIAEKNNSPKSPSINYRNSDSKAFRISVNYVEVNQ